MASGRPWQMLITLQEKKKDVILRRLALLEERMRHAKDLEERLERYQEESGQSYRESLNAGPVRASFLRGSTEFYAKLDQGMAVQKSEIARLIQTIADVRGEILACDMEIMKYRKLVEKDAAGAARREAVAEQKATDNFVSATVARNLLKKESRGN